MFFQRRSSGYCSCMLSARSFSVLAVICSDCTNVCISFSWRPVSAWSFVLRLTSCRVIIQTLGITQSRKKRTLGINLLSFVNKKINPKKLRGLFDRFWFLIDLDFLIDPTSCKVSNNSNAKLKFKGKYCLHVFAGLQLHLKKNPICRLKHEEWSNHLGK